jgi:hypothetical protein
VPARLRYVLCALVLGGTLLAGTAQAQAHELTHHGSGVWIGPGFYTHGTDLEYHFDWECRNTGHVHLNLERDFQNAFTSNWGLDTRLVDHTVAQPPDKARRDNTHKIRPSGFGWGYKPLYRLTVHTAAGCHWGLHALWN